MKKALLVLLAAVMVFSTTVFASEAATEAAPEAATEAGAPIATFEASIPVNTIIWDKDLEDLFISSGYVGTIYTIDALGLEMIVPEGLEKRQPTDEEKQQDIILVFENAETKDRIELVLGPVGECKSLDDVKAYIAEKYPDVSVVPAKINQFDTLSLEPSGRTISCPSTRRNLPLA